MARNTKLTNDAKEVLSCILDEYKKPERWVTGYWFAHRDKATGQVTKAYTDKDFWENPIALTGDVNCYCLDGAVLKCSVEKFNAKRGPKVADEARRLLGEVLPYGRASELDQLIENESWQAAITEFNDALAGSVKNIRKLIRDALKSE